MSSDAPAMIRCPKCEKKYRIKPEQRGRKLKCAGCEAVFRIGGTRKSKQSAARPSDDPIPFSTEAGGDDFLSGLESGEQVAVEWPVPPPPAADMAGNMDLMGAAIPTHRGLDDESETGRGRYAGYFRDILRTHLVLIKPSNIAAILILCIAMGLIPVISYAGCLALAATVVISGWVAGYQLNTVLNSAAGEDELPDLIEGGWMEGVAIPVVKMVVATLFSSIPSTGLYAASYILESNGTISADTAGWLVAAGAYLSFLFFPIVILALAVGGLGDMLRVDLMALTILRAPLAYLAVVITTVLMFSLPFFMVGLLLGGGDSEIGGEMFGFAGIAVALTVASRAIGLYYHHFKDSFAFAWG